MIASPQLRALWSHPS